MFDSLDCFPECQITMIKTQDTKVTVMVIEMKQVSFPSYRDHPGVARDGESLSLYLQPTSSNIHMYAYF